MDINFGTGVLTWGDKVQLGIQLDQLYAWWIWWH